MPLLVNRERKTRERLERDKRETGKRLERDWRETEVRLERDWRKTSKIQDLELWLMA